MDDRDIKKLAERLDLLDFPPPPPLRGTVEAMILVISIFAFCLGLGIGLAL